LDVKIKIAALSAIGILLAVVPALAHKVNIFAYSEGDTIFTESYFPDGRKVQGGKVEVYDSAETKLLEGVTDDKGVFNFKTPKKEDLKIVLIATMGHKNSFLIKADEIEAVAKSDEATDPAVTSAPTQEITPKETPLAATPKSQTPTTKPRRHVEPPKESHTIPALVGLVVIFGLAYLVMRFTNKGGQKKG
jgi:nickel transport protein